MKIILTADIHNGVPGRIDDCIWSMDLVRHYANENGIKVVIILGDLFHDRVNINIEVVNKVYGFFSETDKNYDQQWICFPGNHDMFLKNSWDINSLRPLDRLLQVIEDVSLLTIDDRRFWILPFIHYESVYMKVLDKIEEKREDGDILLTHIGVNKATLNVCFLLKFWNVVNFEESGFERVYTGHFHCHQQVGENVWYPGSIIPFKFDEGLAEHGFFVYDTDKADHEFVPTFSTASEISHLSSHMPPDYITTIDSGGGVLPEADIVNGNNVCLILPRPYTKNEMAEIRAELKRRGAKRVKFSTPKEDEEDPIEKSQIATVSLDTAFESWLNQLDEKKLKDLDKGLLLKINDQVAQEAKEKMVVSELFDD